jgi:hypothetical protein
MPRPLDSGRVNLADHFRRLQSDLSSGLSLASLIEHATAAGSTAEQRWIHLLNAHLPARYRAAPAFVYDPAGHRSRQIDIAIYDHLHAPALYPNTAALHLPSDAIYAVFEVKPTFSRQWLADAAAKAQSVRDLSRTATAPILAGLLAKSSVWNAETFPANLRRALKKIPLDLGCSLDHGSFCTSPDLQISPPNSSLHHFLFTLLSLLSTAPPTPDLS